MPRHGANVVRFDCVVDVTDGMRYSVLYVTDLQDTSYYLRELSEPHKVRVVGETELRAKYEKLPCEPQAS